MTPCKLVYSFQHLEELVVFIFNVVQVEMDTARSSKTLSPIHQWVCCYTPEDCILGKHHWENTKPHICICSYEKMFIRIQRTSTKTFEILDNIIKCYSVDGGILSDKLAVHNLWTFPNVTNLNPVKQWCSLLGEKNYKKYVPPANLYFYIPESRVFCNLYWEGEDCLACTNMKQAILLFSSYFIRQFIFWEILKNSTLKLSFLTNLIIQWKPYGSERFCCNQNICLM